MPFWLQSQWLFKDLLCMCFSSKYSALKSGIIHFLDHVFCLFPNWTIWNIFRWKYFVGYHPNFSTFPHVFDIHGRSKKAHGSASYFLGLLLRPIGSTVNRPARRKQLKKLDPNCFKTMATCCKTSKLWLKCLFFFLTKDLITLLCFSLRNITMRSNSNYGVVTMKNLWAAITSHPPFSWVLGFRRALLISS